MQKLATCSQEVVGIDLQRTSAPANNFIQGDVMTYPFPKASFDFISAVATLHHLPLLLALRRFRSLLKPGGVIAIVGLYRARTLADFAAAAVAMPISRILRHSRPFQEVNAALADPKESLSEIQNACDRALPGAVLRRRLLFRYSLVWKFVEG